MNTRALRLTLGCTGLLMFQAACQLNDTDPAPPAPDLPEDEESSPVQVGTPVPRIAVAEQDRANGGGPEQCPPAGDAGIGTSDAGAVETRDAGGAGGGDGAVPQLVNSGFPQPVDGGFPPAIDAGFPTPMDGGFPAPAEAGAAPLLEAGFPQLPTFDASLPPGTFGGGADAGRR